MKARESVKLIQLRFCVLVWFCSFILKSTPRCQKYVIFFTIYFIENVELFKSNPCTDFIKTWIDKFRISLTFLASNLTILTNLFSWDLILTIQIKIFQLKRYIPEFLKNILSVEFKISNLTKKNSKISLVFN